LNFEPRGSAREITLSACLMPRGRFLGCFFLHRDTLPSRIVRQSRYGGFCSPSHRCKAACAMLSHSTRQSTEAATRPVPAATVYHWQNQARARRSLNVSWVLCGWAGATRSSDAVCSPCPAGSYSNTTGENAWEEGRCGCSVARRRELGPSLIH
jgi:hypothetical protein